MIDAYVVTEDIQVYRGVEAASILNRKNDKSRVTDDGIVSVDKSRWSEAQRYERKTWMEYCLGFNDDHNHKNCEDLGNYQALAGKSFSNAVEFGCGPFTNMRIIKNVADSVGDITLVDPLIKDYLSHPNCAYKSSKMGNVDVDLIALPVEEYASSKQFDLVVMENVIQHCYDVNKVLENILTCLAVGGVFVFKEAIINPDVIGNRYDAGHPLMVHKSVYESFFKHFDVLFRSDYTVVGDDLVMENVCFIGKRL